MELAFVSSLLLILLSNSGVNFMEKSVRPFSLLAPLRNPPPLSPRRAR